LRKKVIFVHGCFWHRHLGCRLASIPKTRVEFWVEKFARNVCRDANAVKKLQAAGWAVLVIWQFETKHVEQLKRRLVEWLG
jgi:DNA mismatch endonuclease (patch repair protein)